MVFGWLYNTLYKGGLMIWFVPERRVFIDGRVDVYPVAMSLRARRADPRASTRDLFAEHGIQCAVVRRDSQLFASLRQDA